ncbi:MULTISPECIES: hypothetical protein [unclassified Adlercreutzia]|uniref:hypothetical protein n=1 Tax=unclassified Adlercreutzia TaxID=2636013 RepID=UPI0013EB251F|nr:MULTISPECIES: hypothetical protein [unclassified Adlercreutzia]
MNTLKRLFTPSPKDERVSAQLGPIYKAGFYVLAFGILFDVFTRYNYLAQTDADGTPLATSSLELAFLIAACTLVALLMARRGIYSDSLRYLEARSFLDTGAIAPTLGITALICIAAVGGRLYNEVALFGWGEVTWAGDIAMFIFMFGMFGTLFLAAQYFTWRSYRAREDRLAQQEEE